MSQGSILSPPTPPPRGGAEAVEQQSQLQSSIVYCSRGVTHYITTYQGELKVTQEVFSSCSVNAVLVVKN